MKQRRPITPQEARIRAEELCARAEHSSGEICDKLLRWGIIPSEADRIVDALIDTRFIDDARFARAYVRDKLEFSRWGRRKISQGLYLKRVARAIAVRAVGEIDSERYREVLRAVIDAKRRTMTEPDTYDGRTRLFRFAMSRGFEPDLVAAVLREKRD